MKWLETMLSSMDISQDLKNSLIEESKKQNMIPKERFDSVNTQLKEANTTLSSVNTELETLKNSAQSSEVLKQQLTDLQKKNTDLVSDYEGKIKGMKIQDYVKGEMSKGLRDQKYFDLLYKEIDHSKLTIKEDGTIEGFDIKTVQDKYPDLFEEQSDPLGSPGNPPRRSPKGDDGTPFGKKLAEMSKPVSTEKNPYF